MQTVLGVPRSSPAICCATSHRPLASLGLSGIIGKDLSGQADLPAMAPLSSRILIHGVTKAYRDARIPVSFTTSTHTHSHTHLAPVKQKPFHISIIKQQTSRDGKLALS